jgi:hypothetical protein
MELELDPAVPAPPNRPIIRITLRSTYRETHRRVQTAKAQVKAILKTRLPPGRYHLSIDIIGRRVEIMFAPGCPEFSLYDPAHAHDYPLQTVALIKLALQPLMVDL